MSDRAGGQLAVLEAGASEAGAARGPAEQEAAWPAEARRAAARALSAAIEGEVRFGLHDRMLYATDASIYQVEPLGVVIPASAEDAARAVAFCRDHGLAVLPRGGGTSLAGQCTARAVVIDVSAALTAVGEVDEAGRRCRAEAGITIDDLNDRLEGTGLFFAPDPSTAKYATVGGCIGNNAAGSHSILYGRTSENLLGVDVVLADGRRARLDEGAALRDPVAAELTERVAAIVRPLAGLIRERYPKTQRRNAGYAIDAVAAQLEAGGGGFEKVNLASLICGSEGTLATTLGAELKLRERPRAKGLAVIAFDELDAAMDALLPILELGPAAVELLDDLVIELARGNLTHRRAVDLLPSPASGRANAVLYVEFFGGSAEEVAARFAALRDRLPDAAMQWHAEPAAMARAWALRKAGEPLLHGVPGDRKPLGFVEDNAVPPERLGEFVEGFRAIVEREGTRAAFYAHASVGVLHVRPLLSLSDPADRERMERIAVDVADLARDLGGVMSGEHGDGRVRGPLLERYFGPEIMDAMRAVKAVFDPENRMNPGNIVEPRPLSSIHELTRIDPGARGVSVPRVETFFEYDDQGDFAHAVNMCNGAGVCRKKTGGVMCPSYMGTLDERHSTRGRGNALRLAISGQLNLVDPGRPLWDDPETEATLDLCLSCKACKSECPSNVDIARLKAEYLAQSYQATGGVPLKSRVFGHIDRVNRLAAFAPGLVNAVNRFPPVRGIINRVLGLHPRRSLPEFRTPLHRQWPGDDAGGRDPTRAERGAPEGPVESADGDRPERTNGTLRRSHEAGTAPVVVLYGDTFTSYNEPRIGLAARRVLEAFGYRVELHRGTAAARALISVGLLAEAINAADHELIRLRRIAAREEVVAIVHLEPSVLSSIDDDWERLHLQASREIRREVARRCMLVEDFIERSWADHPRRPTFRQPPGRLVFHGHCHQKALWGESTSTAVLERLFPGRVDALPTTCCGMAGSFGYTRERFDLSMRIGELGLLPACREAGVEDWLVAPGVSCRHQIKDGAAKDALHPIEVLDRLLEA